MRYCYNESFIQCELSFRQSFQAEIIRHLYSLPAKDKERLISAVVSPEAGGKIIVRYLRGDDLVAPVILQKIEADKPYSLKPDKINNGLLK